MAGMSLTGAGGLFATIDGLTDAVNIGKDGYVVGTNVEYALYNEYGTYKMAAQPHVRPAIDATRRKMGRIAVEANDLDDYLLRVALLLEGEIKHRAPVDTGRLRASYGPPEPL